MSWGDIDITMSYDGAQWVVGDNVTKIEIIEYVNPDWTAVYVNGAKQWEGRICTAGMLGAWAGNKSFKLAVRDASFRASEALVADGACPPMLSEVLE